MEINNELKLLAEEFNKKGYPLYIVGGFVRDQLLNLKSTDIDLSSAMDIDTLQKICEKLKFKTTNINEKLGTILITGKENCYEYTRFRKESYSTNSHSPDFVEFIDDISLDALRRDITINALYYDILNNRVVDLVNGLKDLNKKIIRTPRAPHETLNDDGLRILRLMRFAITYNFKFDKSTYKTLIDKTPMLKGIKKERILKELKMLVTADIKFNLGNKKLIKYINQTQMCKYLFNSTLSNIKNFKKSDTNKFYNLENDLRLYGFYMLVLKTFFKGYITPQNLTFHINALLGTDGIKESNETIKTIEKLYRIYQNIYYGIDSINATINYLSLSNHEREVVKCYLNKKSKNALFDNISYIESKKLPLGIHQLDITAEDLLNIGIKKTFISKILSTLYNSVIECKVKNQKEDLLLFAKNLDETFKEILNK